MFFTGWGISGSIFFPNELKCCKYVKICKQKWWLQEYNCESQSSITLIQLFQTKSILIYLKMFEFLKLSLYFAKFLDIQLSQFFFTALCCILYHSTVHDSSFEYTNALKLNIQPTVSLKFPCFCGDLKECSLNIKTNFVKLNTQVN